MAWTGITRIEHNRKYSRYPGDLSDKERTIAAPLVPQPRPGGRPGTADMREVLNASLYLAGGGIPYLRCHPNSKVTKSGLFRFKHPAFSQDPW